MKLLHGYIPFVSVNGVRLICGAYFLYSLTWWGLLLDEEPRRIIALTVMATMNSLIPVVFFIAARLVK